MKLLIVDDEQKTADYLKKGFIENGFKVDLAADGQEGLALATTVQYSLIILDVMLPKINGLALLENLRQINNLTPVLCLSAKGSTQDRVTGLQLGADDYLVKPFSFSELIARVHNIIRRGQIRPPEGLLQIANLKLDLIRQKVTRNGTNIDLTPKEFTLLSLLMRQAGRVVSKTIIVEQVWDINFDSETNILEVAIRRLRSKVDDPFDEKLIHTIRGVGYVLEDRKTSSF